MATKAGTGKGGSIIRACCAVAYHAATEHTFATTYTVALYDADL